LIREKREVCDYHDAINQKSHYDHDKDAATEAEIGKSNHLSLLEVISQAAIPLTISLIVIITGCNVNGLSCNDFFKSSILGYYSKINNGYIFFLLFWLTWHLVWFVIVEVGSIIYPIPVKYHKITIALIIIILIVPVLTPLIWLIAGGFSILKVLAVVASSLMILVGECVMYFSEFHFMLVSTMLPILCCPFIFQGQLNALVFQILKLFQ